MPTTRKVYAHGELFWWLALLASAVVLLSVLAREARGTRHDSGCPLLTSASPNRHSWYVAQRDDLAVSEPSTSLMCRFTEVSS